MSIFFFFQEKLESTQRETYIQITSLQDENTQVKTVKEEMTKYIRELEQTNDDLERAKRQVFHQPFLTNWQTLFYCFIYIPHLLKHRNT